MTVTPQQRSTRNLPAILLVAAALTPLLATCRDTNFVPDPHVQHPLKVEAKTFAIALPVKQDGMALDGGEMLQLRTFARDYMRRGRSALEIAQPGESGDAAASVSALVRGLEAEGIRRDFVVVTPSGKEGGDGGVIVLSYRGYEVSLPDCGNWSANGTFNPSNFPHSDFGCAYQRNIGLMLSDPGDLSVPRIMDRVPGQESDRVIELFRKGEPTPAKEPAGGQKGTVSAVGKGGQ